MSLPNRIITSGKPYTDALLASTTQEFALGTPWAPNNDPMGRKYRYAKAGAVALTLGRVQQAPVPVPNHIEHVGGAGTVGGAGDTEITVGLTMTTALTEDQYKGGFVCINLVTGLGQIYPIISNDASATPILTLGEAIVTAIDTTTEITLVHNAYNGVVITPTTLTSQPVGVPRIAVAAASFFWLQTAGPAAIVVDDGESLLIGNMCGVPATQGDTGSCGVNTATDGVLGRVMSVAPTDEFAVIDLTLDR
jgi:hypothetical protein